MIKNIRLNSLNINSVVKTNLKKLNKPLRFYILYLKKSK